MKKEKREPKRECLLQVETKVAVQIEKKQTKVHQASQNQLFIENIVISVVFYGRELQIFSQLRPLPSLDVRSSKAAGCWDMLGMLSWREAAKKFDDTLIFIGGSVHFQSTQSLVSAALPQPPYQLAYRYGDFING